MGQKINPIGFRLGTTQGHHSLWFAQPKNYSEGLQEDKKLRTYIQNYVQKNMKTSSGVEGIARIEIQKRIDLIQIIIYMEFPKILIESRPRGIEELQMNLQKEFHYVNRKPNVAITRIEKPYGNPNILDAFYGRFLTAGIRKLANFAHFFDRRIIDAIPNGVGLMSFFGAEVIKSVGGGRISSYLFFYFSYVAIFFINLLFFQCLNLVD